MRGSDAIIAMRMRGVKPAHVNVMDYDAPPHEPRYLEDWANVDLVTFDHPIHSLDFRCLVGLDVSVSGDDMGRVRQICDLAKDAGANVLSGFCTTDKTLIFWSGSEWLKY